MSLTYPFRFSSLVCFVAVLAMSIGTATLDARVVRIAIDTRVSPAFNGQTFGTAGQYETLAGRAFGELDVNDPLNATITDIALAPRNANGRVEYMATFFLVKPIDMSLSSHLLWEDIPNRAARVTISAFDRSNGDIGLSVGWQGDNSGATAQVPAPGNTNDYLVVPVASNSDGSSITGPVLWRVENVGGMASQPLIVYQNPLPYQPATLDTTQAIFTTRGFESMDGSVVSGEATIPSSDWAWARCGPGNLFPGTPDPTQICLRNGFNPSLLYQLRFTAKDPYVLGIGYAAFRDVGTFFRNATQDDFGNPNPIANGVSWMIARGTSQSGNFLRALIQSGFTRDEAGRTVWDAAWTFIAGGRVVLNTRFAVPDTAARLYDTGRETPGWYGPWPDSGRSYGPVGMLDRCTASRSCPKIIEIFSGSELWYLQVGLGMFGPTADVDIPIPRNVRRYYIPGTTHGGGPGGFGTTPLPAPVGPGPNWGACTLAANPMPSVETRNAISIAVRRWLMTGSAPPPSRYPTIAGGNLVAPTRAAMGFPTLPQVLASAYPEAPDNMVNPAFQYDFGPTFNSIDESGILTVVPPVIQRIQPSLVARVDADGNELGGVPVVLREAPLGTYVSWNITSQGFRKGQICGFLGGMIPFARTLAERIASGDPRPSLEERYGDHAGYVAAVTAAADKAMAQGFLLPADRAALIAAAQAGNVLR